MYPSRQRPAPTKPIVPRKLSFVLPGRRTLSEHLPAEIIHLPVSLAERSEHLRKIIVAHILEEPNDRQIHLTGVDPVGFRFYVEWLRTGRIDFHVSAASKSGSGLLLRDCFDLMFAHIVGSLFEEPDFQDYIIDVMARSLSASQTPDLKILEEVFLEKGISNVLRQFVIDRMFAVERKMLSMMRGTVLAADDGETGCEYHVHEEGKCYRDGVKHIHTNYDLTATNVGANDLNMHPLDRTTAPYCPAAALAAVNYANTRPYTMSSIQYIGSDEWCRAVHGSIRNVEPPDLQRYEKPLPTIPPLTPGCSKSPLFSRPTSQSSIETTPASEGASWHEEAVNLPSTQQLIEQCLSRIPRMNHKQAPSTDGLTDPPQAVKPELVLECLRRLNLLPSDDDPERDTVETQDNNSEHHITDYASDEKNPEIKSKFDIADTASIHPSASADTQCELDPSGRSSPKQVSPSVSPVLRSPKMYHAGNLDVRHRTALLPGPEEAIDFSVPENPAGVPKQPRMSGSAEPTHPYPIAGPYKLAQQLEYYGPRPGERERPRPVGVQSQSLDTGGHEQFEEPEQLASIAFESHPVMCELPGESSSSRPRHLETQERSRQTHLRTTTDRPYSHLGFSHPRIPHESKSQHPYAHLGFSKPQLRIVDAQDSNELLYEEPEHRDKGMGKEREATNADREQAEGSASGISSSMDKQERQRWLIASSLAPSSHPHIYGSLKRKPTPVMPSSYIPRYITPSTPARRTPPRPSTPHSRPRSAFGLASTLIHGHSSAAPKRKPAPERGADWLEQQGRNPFAKEAGSGAEVMEKSRKSRLGEMLRSGNASIDRMAIGMGAVGMLEPMGPVIASERGSEGK